MPIITRVIPMGRSDPDAKGPITANIPARMNIPPIIPKQIKAVFESLSLDLVFRALIVGFFGFSLL